MTMKSVLTSFNIWTNSPTFMKFGMNIMPMQAIQTTHFLIPYK
jgi:hypothetical protein